MSRESSFLISASAGTGKTFALATHILRLLLAGEAPHTIVALTFSRAAAAEIFDRVVQRLAIASGAPDPHHPGRTPDEAAAKEESDLFRDIPDKMGKAIRKRYPDGLGVAVFRDTLRAFLAEQHRSLLGTIDSFLGRMVTLFATEIGLQEGMAMLDDDAAALQREAAVASVLGQRGDRAYATLRAVVESVDAGASSKSYHRRYAQVMKDWHQRYLDIGRTPEGGLRVWGDPADIWGPDSAFTALVRKGQVPLAEEASAAADRFEAAVRPLFKSVGGRAPEYLDTFLLTVRETPDQVFGSGAPTPVKNFITALDSHVVTCGGRMAKVELGAAELALLRAVLDLLVARDAARLCDRTRGLWALLHFLDETYHRATRQRGLLVFDDIPRLLAAHMRRDAAALADLAFRFDSSFRHLALDEFQDTSHGQWNALLPTVDELKQSTDDRSLFVVGDAKQAIYGWRGGDSELFRRESESGNYTLFHRDLSFRFRKTISAFVNDVFGNPEHPLSALFPTAPATLWEGLWKKHESASAAEGFVRVSRVLPPSTDIGTKAELKTLPYADAMAPRLKAAEPWKRGLTAAVLVRGNTEGETLARQLQAHGIPAVWEGESTVADHPVMAAVLDLLLLAEIPGTGDFPWCHVSATPLAETLYPDLDHPSAARLSRRVAEDVSRLGLPALLRDWGAAILATVEPGEIADVLRDRFAALVSAAADFLRDETRSGTLFGFDRYVRNLRARTFADSETVKVITMHRSKGLGFDLVFVPLFAKGGGGFPSPFRDSHRPPEWILQYGAGAAKNPVLATAKEEAENRELFEEFCTAYVAFTRAKAELQVFLPEAKKPSSSAKPQFHTHVAQAVGDNISRGDADWYLQSPLKNTYSGNSGLRAPDTGLRTPGSGLPTSPLRRRTPSTEHAFGGSASELFSFATRATERGTNLHARLAAIDWLAPGRQPDGIAADELDLATDTPLRRALERPDGVADLWRERSFEIFDSGKGEWVSGTFDRVVFREDAEGRLIDLYDFKSNRRGDKETPEAFAERMCATYAGQMADYRAALHLLTGVPAQRIRPHLLLLATCEDILLKE